MSHPALSLLDQGIATLAPTTLAARSGWPTAPDADSYHGLPGAIVGQAPHSLQLQLNSIASLTPPAAIACLQSAAAFSHSALVTMQVPVMLDPPW